MGATVDNKRRHQRNGKHDDEADARTRLVPYPHLVVNSTTIHRHNERNGVQKQNALHHSIVNGKNVEDNARKPESGV